ncbi:hypothetical protein D3C72_2449830 [compost metagenome]
MFSGGVSNNPGMTRALEELLGHPISRVKLDTIFAGALGAAVFAQKAASRGESDLSDFALLKAK